MTIDISGVAYAVRSDSAPTPHPLKLSHAQQCVAAAFGFKSLAAFQASDDGGLPLDRESHIVLDVAALVLRGQELQLPENRDELVALVLPALTRKIPGIPVHESLTEFEEALRESVEREVLNDGNVAGALAMINHDGIDEIYLPFDVDWAAIPSNGDPHEISISGHVAMNIDDERPYWGHRVDVTATLWIGRHGRAVWAAVCKVTHAQLYRSDGSEVEDAPAQVSLAEALAEALGLSFDEAEELVDAEVQELSSDDGVQYGLEFDFSDLEAAPRVLRKIEKKHGSLRVQVPPSFFDRVHGHDAKPTRYYIHGDQHEADTSKYYCAQCDLLVDAEHFVSAHSAIQAEDRYFASLRNWQKRPARAKINVRRPATAVNIVAPVALAQKKARDASRGMFYRWLERQAKRADPVGDLARDVKGDRDFPLADSARETLLAYLRRAGASGPAIEAFHEAWGEFSGSNR